MNEEYRTISTTKNGHTKIYRYPKEFEYIVTPDINESCLKIGSIFDHWSAADLHWQIQKADLEILMAKSENRNEKNNI